MVKNKEKPKMVIDKAFRDKVFDHAITLFSGFIAAQPISPDGQLNVDCNKNFSEIYKAALELNLIRLKLEKSILEQVRAEKEKP